MPGSPTARHEMHPAMALLAADRRKPRSDRQYFPISELARRLARRTDGRLEVDEDEADRILFDLVEWFDRGDFDDEILALAAEPPHLRPLKPLLEAEFGQTIPPIIWRRAVVVLRRSAVRRYLDGCGLAGAPRLLAELFCVGGSAAVGKPAPRRRPATVGVSGDTPPRKTEKHKPGPKPKLRKRIASDMLANLKSGNRTVEDLLGDTLDALVAAYGGSRNTASAARKDAIVEFQNCGTLNTENL
jgi:hypothetical protein